jgi:hypothetical protein
MTFASLVDQIIWYINTMVIPLIFLLALVAFLWGVFLYIFYQPRINEARNIIVGGVAVLALMVSIWGVLSILKNSLTDDPSSSFSRPNRPSGNISDNFEDNSGGGVWQSFMSIFESSGEPVFNDCPDCLLGDFPNQ